WIADRCPTSLLTSTRSLTSSVSCIDCDGILNGCTTYVFTVSATTTATTTSSTNSVSHDRRRPGRPPPPPPPPSYNPRQPRPPPARPHRPRRRPLRRIVTTVAVVRDGRLPVSP